MDEPAHPAREGGLVRVRIDLAYDGTDFAGWAMQPGQRTVQGVVEDALATVLRQPRVPLTCAGRTDAGVHARRQVAHADLPTEVYDGAAPHLVKGLAGVLPRDVRVRDVREAPDGFDARFSALVPPLCLPRRGHGVRRRPAAPPRCAVVSPCPRRRRHEPRRGGSARRARLRGVLPATRRRDDGAVVESPRLVPRRRRRHRRSNDRRRRVLPQHGALVGRRVARGR